MNCKVTGEGVDVVKKNVGKLEKLENMKTWKFENLKNDPWDMQKNFCFHVYAQKSLFIGENDNAFF